MVNRLDTKPSNTGRTEDPESVPRTGPVMQGLQSRRVTEPVRMGKVYKGARQWKPQA